MSETEQPVFTIEKIYAKDLSLEIPNAPQIFLEREQPAVEVGLQSEANGGFLQPLFKPVLPYQVSKGFTQEMDVVGVGYKAELKGRSILFALVANAVQGECAVGQVGQRIVIGEEFDLFLGGLGCADVGEGSNVVADSPALVAYAGDGQPLGVDFAVFAPVPNFALPMALVPQALP